MGRTNNHKPIVSAVLAALLMTAVGVGADAANATGAAAPQAGITAAAHASSTSDIGPLWSWEDEKMAKRACDDFATGEGLGGLVSHEVGAATGKPYKGGVSVYGHYTAGGCHVIVRNERVLHGPHYRPN